MNNQSVMIPSFTNLRKISLNVNESDVDSVNILIDSVSFFSERLTRLIQICNS